MSTSRTYVAGAVLTAAQQNDLAQGRIGYAAVSAAQSGMAAGPTDLTGLTVTATVVTGRQIRVTGHGRMQMSDATSGFTVSVLLDGVDQGQVWIGESIGGRMQMHGALVLTPSAGSHTFKLSASRFIGAGTLTLTAAAGLPAYILVEDIGV